MLPWYRRPARAAVTFAGAAAALAIAVWLLSSGGPGVDRGAAGAVVQVQRAVERATLGGPFVYPGAESLRAVAMPVYRSGEDVAKDSLNVALEILFERYRRGDATADEIYWLVAGNAAAENWRMARDLAAQLRPAVGNEYRLALVDAIAAEGDAGPVEAERLLIDLARQYPRDPAVAANLAAHYIRREKYAEALRALDAARPAPPGTALQSRIDALREAGGER